MHFHFPRVVAGGPNSGRGMRQIRHAFGRAGLSCASTHRISVTVAPAIACTVTGAVAAIIVGVAMVATAGSAVAVVAAVNIVGTRCRLA